MEELKEKKQELVIVKKDRQLLKRTKQNRIIKCIINVLLWLSKLVLKLTVIVALYSVVFSAVVYYSNQFTVSLMRESEANKKSDPVLEALRKDKNNAKDDKKEENKEENKEKDKDKEKDNNQKENKKETEKKNTKKKK